jgi:riboflavin synthase
MFTGIVERTGVVKDAVDSAGGRRLRLAIDWADLVLGQSVAVNGCCLTIADFKPGMVEFDVIPETLEKTNLGLLCPSDCVNLERSLRFGDRVDGHLVQGHVDGRATLLEKIESDAETRLRLEAPEDLAKYLIPKGSVALDGVSLTLARVEKSVFEVALIPTTIRLTTLGEKAVGWPFNLETDLFSKSLISWVERLGLKSWGKIGMDS